jgi:hypothetical protein
MLTVAIFLRASATLLSPGNLSFRVTPKGAHAGLPPAMVGPAAVLFGFNLTAVGIGLFRLVRGDPDPGALVLTTFFAAQFAIASALALAHAWERRGVAERFSFPVQLAAAPGVTVRRLNHELAYAECSRALRPGEAIDLDLGLGHPVVARVEALDASGIARLALAPLAAADRDALDRRFFQSALPAFLATLRHAPPGPPPDPDPLGCGPVRELLPVRSAIL